MKSKFRSSTDWKTDRILHPFILSWCLVLFSSFYAYLLLTFYFFLINLWPLFFYLQAISLSTANEASTLANRYIVRAFSTSGHTSVNTCSVVASGEVKEAREPNLTDPTKKAVHGGVSYILTTFFLLKRTPYVHIMVPFVANSSMSDLFLYYSRRIVVIYWNIHRTSEY